MVFRPSGVAGGTPALPAWIIKHTLRVSIEIGDSQAANFETVVDEGTLFTMIPRSTLAGLGISPGWRRTLALADGREREFDMARDGRLDGVTSSTIVIFREEGAAPSLGAYTLTGLGLSVDPSGNRLVTPETPLRK